MPGKDFVVDENVIMNLQKIRDEEAAIVNKGIGLWGNRALDYIYSDEGTRFILRFDLEARSSKGINEYGKMIDRKASELRDILEPQYYALPQYQLNEDFMHNVQVHNAVKQAIDEEIYAQLIYVDELVRP